MPRMKDTKLFRLISLALIVTPFHAFIAFKIVFQNLQFKFLLIYDLLLSL